jgi:hypothetical protein
MLIAYVDESGNAGLLTKGGTKTFTLGCVIVPADRWPEIFNRLIGYRRMLKDKFGIPVRAEIKANYLLRNGGPFRKLNLSEKARFAIYRGLMRIQPKLGLRTFAVVVRKDLIKSHRLHALNREIAWEYLFQRLERLTTTEKTTVLLVHDEGEGAMVRAIARKARRIGTAGSAFGSRRLKVPFGLLLDDPVPRSSNQSYFLQLADLNAFAGFRRLYPPPPGSVVVPQKMWEELGTAIYKDANYLAGGPPGVASWPK